MIINIFWDYYAYCKAGYYVADSGHDEATSSATSTDREKLVAYFSLENIISDAPNPQCLKYVEMLEYGN